MAASLIGMVAIITVFLVAMAFVNRNAVKQHEADFNAQQKLQVFLVKQSLQAGLDEIINRSLLITALFAKAHAKGGLESVAIEGDITLVRAIDNNILGYAFVPLARTSPHFEFHDLRTRTTIQRLMPDWTRQARDYFKNTRLRYFIAPFHANTEAQLMGIVTPVRRVDETLDGYLVIVANLRPMLEAYIRPMRSGQFGAGYLLDGQGTIVYDHEEEIIGRSVFDGMHDKYPDLLAVDRRLVSEPSGESAYSFTVQRGGDVSRKLIAWNAVEVGYQKLVVCLSAPDIEINAALDLLKFQNILLAGALGLVFIVMCVFIFHKLKAAETVRSEQMFRRFSEASWEGILIHDQGIVLEGNDQFYQMLGYDPDSVDNLLDIHDFIAEECRAEVDKRIESSDLTPYEIFVKRMDGSRFPVMIRVREMEYNGRPVRFVALRDISEQKRAEEEMKSFNARLEKLVEERTKDLEDKNIALEAANKQLQAMDAMKSEFLSSVSHEIRTPLTSVLGFAKIIERDLLKAVRPLPEDDPFKQQVEKIDENLHIIIDEGERLTRLINDVLDLARIEGGRQQWNETTFALSEVARGAAQTISPLFRETPVKLEVAIEDDVPDIRMDRDCMHQVLFNLLDNALKYTEAGEVTLSVQKDDAGGVYIKVRDTGSGMPAAELAEIFNKFYQTRTSDTVETKPKGTGLGLAICKRIVEHYQGTIRAESEPGKGSTFVITLPPTIIA